MLPPAPETFSTTTGWPQIWLSLSAMIRAMMSTGPAGGVPRIILTARSGYPLCATALLAVENIANAAISAAITFVMIFIPPAFFGSYDSKSQRPKTRLAESIGRRIGGLVDPRGADGGEGFFF